MKNKILGKLNQLGDGISFADLSKIEGFEGDMMYGFPDKNIYFWPSCSNQAIDALEELLQEEKVVLKPTHSLVYQIHGLIPKIPVAKQNRRYVSAHWLPIVLNKGEKFSAAI